MVTGEIKVLKMLYWELHSDCVPLDPLCLSLLLALPARRNVYWAGCTAEHKLASTATISDSEKKRDLRKSPRCYFKHGEASSLATEIAKYK